METTLFILLLATVWLLGRWSNRRKKNMSQAILNLQSAVARLNVVSDAVIAANAARPNEADVQAQADAVSAVADKLAQSVPIPAAPAPAPTV